MEDGLLKRRWHGVQQQVTNYSVERKYLVVFYESTHFVLILIFNA